MSKTAGIIAEYNPFHKGHAYQIQKTRELTGADYICVLLSGDFVQRGTPAIFDKYIRTRMALLGGADVVLELPFAYASGSAEFFAKGGVGIFHQLGAIDFLSFGSEAGDISLLFETARLLLTEPPEYRDALKKGLKAGHSFPLARKEALCQSSFFSRHPQREQLRTLLDTPNNILGIEYCKALLYHDSPIQPVTIKRKGSGYHDTRLLEALSSASAIRAALLSPSSPKASDLPDDHRPTLEALRPVLPKAVFSCLVSALAEASPLTEDDFSLPLKYQLLLHTPQELCAWADMSPELSRRIGKNLNQFSSFSQFAALLKTKELTRTRIHRALLHALLKLPASAPTLAPSYVRLLGMKRSASPLLRRFQECSTLPLLTKASDYKKRLPLESQPLFEQDLLAADLYETVLKLKINKPFLSDLAKSPVIL